MKLKNKKQGGAFMSRIDNIMDFIEEKDPVLGSYIKEECRRQRNNIELIASENIVSEAVMLAMATVPTNKYAEGYSGKRYYGGCEAVDKIETLAVERLKELYGCEYANVQPHSGAQANLTVQFAMLEPGDKMMGMSLDCGGHLTHGSPVNFSGKYFNIIPYGVNEEGLIDYDALEDLAMKERPKLICAGASAYPRIIDFERFRKIADKCGAYLWVDMAHIAGLVAAGLHPSPVPYAHVVTSTTHKTLRGPRGGFILSDKETNERFNFNKALFPGVQGGPLENIIAAKAVCFGEALKPEFKEYQEKLVKNCAVLSSELVKRGFKLVSGGTDNHLILIDLTNMNVTGKEMQSRCDSVNITLNKNSIPNEPRSPFITSGIRVGTAAITSRGFIESDMAEIAECLKLCACEYEEKQDEIRDKVNRLCRKYPLYED